MWFNVLTIIAVIYSFYLLFSNKTQNNKLDNLAENRRNTKDILNLIIKRLDDKDLEIKSIQSNISRNKETVLKISAQVKVLNSKNFNERQDTNKVRKLPQSPVRQGGNIK